MLRYINIKNKYDKSIFSIAEYEKFVSFLSTLRL